MKRLGIDIGSSHLKCVLAGRDLLGRVRLLAQLDLELEADILHSAEEGRLAALEGALREFVCRHRLHGIEAAISFSGFMTHLRFLALPPAKSGILRAILEQEACSMPAAAQEGMLYNFALLPGEERGVICLCREQELEKNLEAVCRAGLAPGRVLPGQLALLRLPEVAGAAGLTGILEIGAKTSALAVMRGGTPLTALRIPFGSEEPLRGFQRKTGCDRAQALAALNYWLDNPGAEGREAAPDAADVTSVQEQSAPVPGPEPVADISAPDDLPSDAEIDEFFGEPVLCADGAGDEFELEDIGQEPDTAQALHEPDLVEEDDDELCLSDGELGVQSAVPPGVFPLPDTPVAPVGRGVLPELVAPACEYFPQAFSRIFSTLQRSMYVLRDEEGIAPEQLRLLLYGHCAGTPALVALAGECLGVAECARLLPAGVRRGCETAYALAYSGLFPLREEPDMLPPEYAQVRQRREARLLRAACVLLALLPLPFLFAAVLRLSAASAGLHELEERLSAQEAALQEEQTVTARLESVRKDTAGILAAQSRRETFFALLPALNELGQGRLWIEEFALRAEAGGFSGEGGILAWSYGELDAFIDEAVAGGLISDCVLNKAKSDQGADRNELTVGQIEGDRRAGENVSARLSFLALPAGDAKQ